MLEIERGLSDTEWGFFKPLVIETGALSGRPPADHRRTLDTIFWIARTGAPWRDLPEELGNWNSVHRQFRRWTASGLWDPILAALAEGSGGGGVQMIDSTTIRAHHYAAAQGGRLKIRPLAVLAVDSTKSTFGPTLRVFRSLCC